MSDTGPDVPSGATQQSPPMGSLAASSNAMAMTPGIIPPGNLNLSFTENLEADVEQLYDHRESWHTAAGIQSSIVSSLYRCRRIEDFYGSQFVIQKIERRKIFKKFDQYTIGELNETFERYNFNSRNQEENESIDVYVTALRTLAKRCSFRDFMHDSILRNRIVLGIRDKNTRKRLLQERKLQEQ